MNQLAKAISLASEVFENKTDKSGVPYILHCLWVMNAVSEHGEEVMCMGVMHDVVEDSDITIDDLIKMGFSTRIISALILLTHKKGVPYDDYIKAISHNPDAKIIKLADLRHNSDITRLKGLRQKDFERMEKYNRAFIYLNN